MRICTTLKSILSGIAGPCGPFCGGGGELFLRWWRLVEVGCIHFTLSRGSRAFVRRLACISISSVLNMNTLATTLSPQARFTYLGISAIVRRQHPITTCKRASSGGTFHRSDFTNQSFTGIYEAGGPTEVRTTPRKPACTPLLIQC